MLGLFNTVAGRALVLRANYRNASEILHVASRLISNDSYDDLDGDLAAGLRDQEIRRANDKRRRTPTLI